MKLRRRDQVVRARATLHAAERVDVGIEPGAGDQRRRLDFEEAFLAKVVPHELASTFATRTTDDWCALLTEHRIRHAPVRDHAALIDDPGVWANGYLARTSSGDPIVVSPVRFSDTPARAGEGAPALGEHTDDVLREAGLTDDEITALRAANAI